MSNPRSTSDELAAREPAAEELAAHELAAEELSPDNRQLLALARRQRSRECAPDDVRARARARVLAEAAVCAAAHAVPTAPLVSVARPSLRFGLQLFAVAAAVLASVIGAPVLLRTVSERWATGPEPPGSTDWQASGPAGELLSHASSPLLRLPLLPLPEDQPAVSGPSLFAERPFGQSGGAWQVRRWNDPKAGPDEPAVYGLEDGALCVTLAAGERALGGWPWPAASAAGTGAASPEKVAIAQGRPYRLGFRAWVHGPLPSQVLLGVGHSQFPFVAAAAARVQVASSPERFAMDFVAAHDDDAVGVAFLATNRAHADPTRVCFADVTLVAR